MLRLNLTGVHMSVCVSYIYWHNLSLFFRGPIKSKWCSVHIYVCPISNIIYIYISCCRICGHLEQWWSDVASPFIQLQPSYTLPLLFKDRTTCGGCLWQQCPGRRSAERQEQMEMCWRDRVSGECKKVMIFFFLIRLVYN